MFLILGWLVDCRVVFSDHAPLLFEGVWSVDTERRATSHPAPARGVFFEPK